MIEIIINQERYALPEGFTTGKENPNRTNFPPFLADEEIYDETGRSCVLYNSGFTSKVGDNQPYITTSMYSGGRRIPLQLVK